MPILNVVGRGVKTMARYFFNLCRAGTLIRDPFGERFKLAELAKKYALRVAYELTRNQPRSRWINSSLLVVNEAGRIVFRVALIGDCEGGKARRLGPVRGHLARSSQDRDRGRPLHP